MIGTIRNQITGAVLPAAVIVFFFVASCVQHMPVEFEDDEKPFGFNDAYEPLIDSILNLLTLEEKIHMIHGSGMFVSGGVERLGIPELHYSDGPTGIREELERDSWAPLNLDTDSVTFFPTGTALAATWNSELAYRYGEAIGNEANARGKHILLGPAVNIIRTPLCGRNFEYFSEDPLLASEMAVEYVKGVQMQDVGACVKHYVLNNQEYQRWIINVEVDERALREIYLPVYKSTALEAEAYTFMGSYNKFRGVYVCENDYLLNRILKGEWKYKGAVISDWGATHSAVKAAVNGLDVEMGGRDRKYHFVSLTDSVNAGIVSERIIDDKVRRILRVMYNCKIADSTRLKGEANSSDNRKVARDVAGESIVLLKNSDDLLPLRPDKISRLAVIGENAVHEYAQGGFTAGVKARYEVTALEGLKRKLGDRVEIQYSPGYKEKFVVTDT
ncbi:MAG: glycoside hydrolase family 3 N-terminal domain-containing protein, partial [Bacteroidales bacterium]